MVLCWIYVVGLFCINLEIILDSYVLICSFLFCNYNDVVGVKFMCIIYSNSFFEFGNNSIWDGKVEMV